VLTAGVGAEDPDAVARNAAFVLALQQLGWTTGRNLRIDYFWGLDQSDTIRKHAMELAGLAPDVILASGSAGLAALLQATRTVPIVFVNVADPVGAGFVDSLGRPGGNATGFMQFEYSLSGKWLELLKQIAPNVTRAAVLLVPILTSGIGQFAVIQSVAPAIGVDVIPVNVRDAGEIERAVAASAPDAPGAAGGDGYLYGGSLEQSASLLAAFRKMNATRYVVPHGLGRLSARRSGQISATCRNGRRPSYKARASRVGSRL